MNIDSIFEKYPKNLIGFRVNDKIRIVDFWVDVNWEVYKKEEDSRSYDYKLVKHDDTKTRAYYVIFSQDMTHTELFSILSSMFEFNLDNEKKEKLYREKLIELKELFKNHSYDELQKIELTPPVSAEIAEIELIDNSSTEDISMVASDEDLKN